LIFLLVVDKKMADAVAWHSRNASEFNAKYATSAAFGERLAIWSSLISHYVKPGSSVLDAGCGPGLFSDVAATEGGHVFGFDGSFEMIELARARSSNRINIEFEVCKFGEKTIFEDRRFDVILCSSVLEYVDNCWESFDWLADKLKPSGVILFSMPNGSSLYRHFERLSYNFIGWPPYYANVKHITTARAAKEQIGRKGFKIRSLTYYAAVPVFSRLARLIRRPDLGDSLFVIACERHP
jgi:2-polyprenyl-3-methyl-5-hydroxy-6-metoxy-1,4-benzoquinol methylase